MNTKSPLFRRLPRAVIFDMDGVLLNSEPFIARAARRMFAEKGLAVKESDFRPFIGAGEDRFIGGVAEKYGFILDPARDKARTYQLYLEIIRGQLRPLPGVAPFLAACRESGRRIALASSADQVKVNGNLREIGLDRDSFDAVVTGEDVARKKPDPEIFLLAAKRLGCPPAETLVVEDAVNGVTAARAAGARCLGLTTSFNREQLAAAGADWCAADLAGAPAACLDWPAA